MSGGTAEGGVIELTLRCAKSKATSSSGELGGRNLSRSHPPQRGVRRGVERACVGGERETVC